MKNGQTKKQIDPQISHVFTLLKVLSIFMVMAGHFFKEIQLGWLPVTVGLLVFSFYSGYFTSLKYKGNFSKRIFWNKKFERLAINLFVINTALLLLFLFEGRTGIWSWQTLVNVTGLNGFLNWFRIQDPSPFGAGMWFFTLLILFYLVYPLLEKIANSHFSLFTLIFILISFCLNKYINFGHALWLTASGFVIGIWAEKTHFKISANIARIFSFIILATMVWVNLSLKFNGLNFFFLLFFSLAGIYSCMDLKIPDSLHHGALFLSGALFEIYLIHSYLFITPTDNRALDFCSSIVLIVCLSKILSFIANKINPTSVKVKS